MQGSNQDFIDYSPVPDSPPQSPREPEMLNAFMRSDQSPVFTRQHRFWQERRPQHQQQQQQQQQQQPRQRQQRARWRDVQVPEENVEEKRRIFKGKWGPRFCRNQSCKKSPRRSPRSPRSPPPTAAMVAGGTQTKTKTRTNRRRKCKHTRRK